MVIVLGWKCPRCRQKHEAYKNFGIWRLPSVLMMDLKWLTYSGSTLRKAHDHVSFSLSAFDLSWMTIRSSQISGGLEYDLYAVVGHPSSAQAGHYTGLCRNQPEARWFQIKDASVKEVPAAKVKEYMSRYNVKHVA